MRSIFVLMMLSVFCAPHLRAESPYRGTILLAELASYDGDGTNCPDISFYRNLMNVDLSRYTAQAVRFRPYQALRINGNHDMVEVVAVKENVFGVLWGNCSNVTSALGISYTLNDEQILPKKFSIPGTGEQIAFRMDVLDHRYNLAVGPDMFLDRDTLNEPQAARIWGTVLEAIAAYDSGDYAAAAVLAQAAATSHDSANLKYPVLDNIALAGLGRIGGAALIQVHSLSHDPRDLTAALRMLDLATKSEPYNPDGFVLKAVAWELSGSHESALAQWAQARAQMLGGLPESLTKLNHYFDSMKPPAGLRKNLMPTDFSFDRM